MHQRLIYIVFVDGQDIGREQIRTGMVWWYQQYAKEQPPEECRDYAQAEARAKDKKVGVWNRKYPTPPWEWRHKRRENR